MFKGNNMNEEIILKSENGVGIITLNRPDRLNALTYNIVQKMNDFLDKCESDDDIKCVIIEGAGEKAFCAGGDVVLLRKQVLDEGGPPTELSEKFFYDEYLLNYKIKFYYYLPRLLNQKYFLYFLYELLLSLNS